MEKSEAKKQRIIKAEQKQLAKLQKVKAKGSSAFYFALILGFIALINIIDEVTSNLSVTVQSSFITEFFVNQPFFGKNYTYEEGLSLHTAVSVFSYVFGVITPFYKSLADKFGRKPLFAMSTLGMSIGLLITYFSPNYIVFLIGSAFISFFMGHDMQIIYIIEEAPDKLRARLYSILKALGILGVVFVPTLRALLMGDDATKWRRIFLVPAIVGVIACLLVIFFARDTRVFINERIAYLSRPYDERQEEKRILKEKKKTDKNKTGVFNAVKVIFSNKDTKALMLSHIIFDTGIAAIALYYESSMHIAGMSTMDITKALFVQPIVYAVLTFISGFIADRFGRKTTIISASVLCLSGFVFFTLGINNLWNPYLIGALCGLYQGCYWIGRDYMNVMMTEKMPTEIRASAVGAEGLLVCIGMAVGYLLMIVGINFAPVWVMCLAVSIPVVTLATILFAANVKETKGANLDLVDLIN